MTAIFNRNNKIKNSLYRLLAVIYDYKIYDYKRTQLHSLNLASKREFGAVLHGWSVCVFVFLIWKGSLLCMQISP